MASKSLHIQLQVSEEALAKAVETALSSRRDIKISRLRQDEVPSADLVLTDLGMDPAAGLVKARRFMENAEVFVLGPAFDPELLRQSMRTGVREYLFLPLEQADLMDALDRYITRRTSRIQGGAGRIIAIAGSKGGVGSTTVAVNLALELTRLMVPQGHNVALMDMNTAFGDIPLFLDLEPLHHWGEVFQNADRLDGTFLMSLLTKHTSGLHILPAPDRLDVDFEMAPMTLEQLMSLFQEHFAFTIVDLGAYLDEVAFTLMAFSSETLLVSTLNLPCLANLKRLGEALERLETVPKENIQLIFNRSLQHSEISVEDAQKILGRKALALIPNDYESTVSAINQGKPLVNMAPKSPVTRAIKKLALALAEDRSDQKKTSESKTPWKGLRLFSK